MKEEQTIKVLKDLSLEDIIPRGFFKKNITLDIINKLSIYEFRKFGLINRSYNMKLREKCNVYGSYCLQKTAGNGAPKFDIPKPLL